MATYDTIAGMEDALIERVKAVFPTVEGRSVLRAVESLPGEWDDDTLRRLLRAAPGVFIAFSGGPTITQDTSSVTLDATWVAYSVTSHASGEAARRRGDAREIGGYEIMQRLAGALHQWTPLEDQGTLLVASLENLYTGTIDRQGVAVYALTLKGELTLPKLFDLADLGDFVTFDARWDVPPHANRIDHELWLQERPGERQQPDARDEVTLPRP